MRYVASFCESTGRLRILILLGACAQAYYKFFEQLTAPKEDDLFRKSQKLQPGTLENVFSVVSHAEPSPPRPKDEEGTTLSRRHEAVTLDSRHNAHCC